MNNKCNCTLLEVWTLAEPHARAEFLRAIRKPVKPILAEKDTLAGIIQAAQLAEAKQNKKKNYDTRSLQR